MRWALSSTRKDSCDITSFDGEVRQQFLLPLWIAWFRDVAFMDAFFYSSLDWLALCLYSKKKIKCYWVILMHSLYWLSPNHPVTLQWTVCHIRNPILYNALNKGKSQEARKIVAHWQTQWLHRMVYLRLFCRNSSKVWKILRTEPLCPLKPQANNVHSVVVHT